MFTPYWALLLGVPLSFALRLAQHLGVLSTVALAGGYRQVAGGRWYWSHESGATQAEINIHLSMMSALSIYTVLMRTNSPKQPGCLQLTFTNHGTVILQNFGKERPQIVLWSLNFCVRGQWQDFPLYTPSTSEILVSYEFRCSCWLLNLQKFKLHRQFFYITVMGPVPFTYCKSRVFRLH